MITIQGSQAGINTIRNISLLHRSLSRTMRRLEKGDALEMSRDSGPDIALTHRMRNQIGSVADQIRDLEQNLQRNETAAKALEELREIVGGLKEIVTQAAADKDATVDENRAYQDKTNERVNAYNEKLTGSEFAGQKLFVTSKATVFRIFELPALETDSPESATDAVSKVESTLRELNEIHIDLSGKSRREYDVAIRNLQVASQNLAASDAGVQDSMSARLVAIEANQMIQHDAKLAANAQGHLTSESVFQLLHA